MGVLLFIYTTISAESEYSHYLNPIFIEAERLTAIKDVDYSGNVINSGDYTYDADGQITKEASINEPTASTVEDSSNFSDKMSYDKNNRLLTYNGNNISYDADGNMTNGLLKGVNSDFSYDSDNRLNKAGGTTYGYDALNNRIWQSVNGYKTTYVYDNTSSDLSRLLVSTDSNGNSVYYVYGVGLIGEQDTNSSYSIYHYDLRGSTIAITNMQKTVTDRYSYGPYGELLSHTGTATTSFLYNGRDGVMTDSNGLDYMRSRYYSTDMKRFINADILKGSIENGETLNNYAYANGNPISMVDPFGRCADETDSEISEINKEISEIDANLSEENERQMEEVLGAEFGTMEMGLQTEVEDFSTDMTTMGRSYSYEGETDISMSNSEFGNLPSEIDEAETTTVGRWMSQEEYDKMIQTGKVQMSAKGNRTYVANPADINAFPSAPKGSLYVEFDVHTNSLIKAGKEAWAQIPGPGSLTDRLNQRKGLPPITDMPNATNITIVGGN